MKKAMYLVLKNGKTVEVDTSFVFDNQYNTVDGERIMDTQVQKIINDIRLGEFYCCSKKQGTYEEVVQAIADERSKIDQCEGCFWFHQYNRVESRKEEHWDRGRKFLTETTVYEVTCGHKPKYDNRCVHDIHEEPVLFREKNFCFFCEYPEGIPDMKPLKKFMVDNAAKYGIISRWNYEDFNEDSSFLHMSRFGSYTFSSNAHRDGFELDNARNHYRFYVDFHKKKFILVDSIGYKVVDKLCTSEYNHETRECKDVPIKNYDKFANWFWQIVDDFMREEAK
jgi:hypothetical protein